MPARVVGGPVNLRAAPRLDAKVVSVVPEGVDLFLVARADDRDNFVWCHVNVVGFGDGYMAGLLLGSI
jgi:hypothetical protein